MEDTRHTLSILAEDHPGVLMRVAALIYRRGYNIHSLSVGPTHEPNVSRFTVVISSDGRDLKPLLGQLRKLVEVLWAGEIPERLCMDRRIALLKVRCPVHKRAEVLRLGQVFRCRVLELADQSITLEVTGEPMKINACVKAMEPYGILEAASSGSVGMTREGSSADEAVIPKVPVAC